MTTVGNCTTTLEELAQGEGFQIIQVRMVMMIIMKCRLFDDDDDDDCTTTLEELAQGECLLITQVMIEVVVMITVMVISLMMINAMNRDGSKQYDHQPHHHDFSV